MLAVGKLSWRCVWWRQLATADTRHEKFQIQMEHKDIVQ